MSCTKSCQKHINKKTSLTHTSFLLPFPSPSFLAKMLTYAWAFWNHLISCRMDTVGVRFEGHLWKEHGLRWLTLVFEHKSDNAPNHGSCCLKFGKSSSAWSIISTQFIYIGTKPQRRQPFWVLQCKGRESKLAKLLGSGTQINSG